MKHVSKLVVLTAVLAVTPAVFAANPFTKDEVKWQENLFAAHRVAQAEQKPILVVFGADWCGYCKKLEKETLNSPQLSKYINETFVAVHLDADVDKKVAEILEVESLPCSVILSPDADLLGKIKGYHTPGPFYQKLAAARQLHAKTVQQTSAAQ